ncbi:heavy metal translocating P-type ATPase [uncultured Roseovarius sp.]|uniref:heavy metal translocating P-type ATPase n=1 Tax=uncultured Roseovarius sp. TaxID=293344 RepID=UPI00262DD4B0|nr:heavy metal translocating P-type ATPase [uncultured Roseovarius sp.]
MTAPQTLRIEIDGMSCAGCAGRAERALTALPGIRDVSVNFAAGSAQMQLVSAELHEVTEALNAAGYPARAREITLSIRDLSCASSVGRAEAALHAVPGVVTASVNLASAQAQVRFLAGMTDAETLARALTQAGYPAHQHDAAADDQTDRRQQEAQHARRSFLIAAILTLPVFVLEMGSHFIPGMAGLIDDTMGRQNSWMLQFILTTIVLFWPGREFFTRGIPALIRAAPDMNSLVALGTSAAWAFSTLSLLAPSLLPAETLAVYFEAAAVIVTLILLGRWLEARAKGRTGAAIRKLIGLQPKTAQVERGGEVIELAIEEVTVGDILHVRPGERIAVDGEVTEGSSYVDESMISGEPVPVAKDPGAAVVGGTINGSGALAFRATKVGRDTVLARIIAMVEQAQGAKLPIQALADRVVRVFVPVVIVLAVLTVLVWGFYGPAPVLSYALVAGVSVLIIACPCAMGLATPTSIMVGTGRAAELGVLFRKGDALQQLDEVQVIAFDKTGTLTEGQPTLIRMDLAQGFERDVVLRLVAAAEGKSEHPIGRAIEAAARGLNLPNVSGFTAIGGHGLRAKVEGRDVLVGTERLMQREGISCDAFAGAVTAMAAKGQTPVFAAIDETLAAAMAVSDAIKPSARAVVERLHAAGLKVAMITGDTEATAQAIAGELGIDHVTAGVLPEGKVEAVHALQDRFGAVAFVGDGINDAPALARAEVGLAVGSGTDVAIEAADIVLMSGDLSGVVNALHLSRRTMRNIRQNLFWAFAYNAALIPVAAGVLYPLTGMLLSPMLAAGAMALSSVFVLSNALRLRGMTPAMHAQSDPAPQHRLHAAAAE